MKNRFKLTTRIVCFIKYTFGKGSITFCDKKVVIYSLRKTSSFSRWMYSYKNYLFAKKYGYAKLLESTVKEILETKL